MPNWCSNQLIVTGPPADVTAFVTAAAGADTALDLDRLVPVPASDDQLLTHVQLWGTKWGVDADAPAVHTVGGRAVAHFRQFDSAWSPPVPAVISMSQDHPSLTFHLVFDEGLMDFAGVLHAHAGAGDVHDGEWTSQAVLLRVDDTWVRLTDGRPLVRLDADTVSDLLVDLVPDDVRTLLLLDADTGPVAVDMAADRRLVVDGPRVGLCREFQVAVYVSGRSDEPPNEEEDLLQQPHVLADAATFLELTHANWAQFLRSERAFDDRSDCAPLVAVLDRFGVQETLAAAAGLPQCVSVDRLAQLLEGVLRPT